MNPIGGRNQTFSRFYRHAFVLAFDAYEMATVNRIFTTISEWHFSQGFLDKVTLLAKVNMSFFILFCKNVNMIIFQTVASAICGFYEQVKKVLLPTPQKFYYMFSFRDISKIFESIALVPAKKLTSMEKLMRLWAHETYRVYFDRYISVTNFVGTCL